MSRIILLLFNVKFIPRLVGRLLVDHRVPIRLKLLLPAALLYLISPIDFVSDILPVLGWIDDGLVIIASLLIFLWKAPKDAIFQHLRQREGIRVDSTPGPKTSEVTVIDGHYRYSDDDESDR